jgi:hypothetical protein
MPVHPRLMPLPPASQYLTTLSIEENFGKYLTEKDFSASLAAR